MLQVDVSVGDPIVPGPVETALPTLLGEDPIGVLAYPVAMVVAEKLVTALHRGRANTRWRDFADLALLLGSHDLDPTALEAAVREVGRHRQVPARPLAAALAGKAPEAQPRWRVWRRRQGLDGRVPESFAELLELLDEATREVLAAPSCSFGSIEAGPRHACGIVDSGEIICWGDDHSGESAPQFLPFQQIDSGAWTHCGVLADGTGTCRLSRYTGDSVDMGPVRLDPPAGTFQSVASGRDPHLRARAGRLRDLLGERLGGHGRPPDRALRLHRGRLRAHLRDPG